jgi:hypothetical protein
MMSQSYFQQPGNMIFSGYIILPERHNMLENKELNLLGTHSGDSAGFIMFSRGNISHKCSTCQGG